MRIYVLVVGKGYEGTRTGGRTKGMKNKSPVRIAKDM
jgi:hypothetical protein